MSTLKKSILIDFNLRFNLRLVSYQVYLLLIVSQFIANYYCTKSQHIFVIIVRQYIE